MIHKLALDRFEGDGKRLAVLVTERGVEVTVPRELLPDRASPGDLLRWSLEVDAGATRAVRGEAKRLIEELERGDPGGDVVL